MAQLLKHLKVIDVASFLAGPGAATVLGDYGADVIKVEPFDGDGYRQLSKPYHIDYVFASSDLAKIKSAPLVPIMPEAS